MEVRCVSESVKLHNATCGVAHTVCVVPHGLGRQSPYVETRVEWAGHYTRAEFYGRFGACFIWHRVDRYMAGGAVASSVSVVC
jgi:hypothetical protein